MPFKIQNKKIFFSFVGFALIALLPPWFIDFRNISMRWSLLWLTFMAFFAMVISLFMYLDNRKREIEHRGESDD
jgi:hypothetical protein